MNLNTFKLGDIADLSYGKMPNKNKIGKGPFEVFSGYRYLGNYPDSNCKKGDLVVVARGVGGTGDLKIARSDCYLTNLSIRIHLDPSIALNKYVFYKFFLKNLRYLDSGSAQSQITIRDLENLKLSLPDITEQQKVVDFISFYSDLIEINEKRIKILEEMAQRLYKEWFTKFKFPGYKKVKMNNSPLGNIPEGWVYGKLGDKIIIKKGKNITKNTIILGEIPVIAAGIEPAYFHNQANTPAPVITISASGANAGFLNLHFKDIWASDCSLINQEATPYIFYYYQLLSSKKNEIDNLQRGAAQPHVYPKDLMSLKVLHASDSLIKDFEDLVLPIFKLIANLQSSNYNLTKTRDLLIPQLVTGKRKLKN